LPERSVQTPNRSQPHASVGVEVSVLRGFELRCDGNLVALPWSAQRLVAFLALHDRPLQRSYVAGSLWLDSSEVRAGHSLRTALWRLRQPRVRVVEDGSDRLSLVSSARVDLWETSLVAEDVLREGALPESIPSFRDALSSDLLPDWYEDWVLVERERFRQLRMHTLETLCRRLTAAGRWAEAVDAGLASVAGEPLRESGQRALIAAHIAEGNHHEALRQYNFYCTMLDKELGVSPSQQMEELIASARK
jgi:DNA-binding SARP family transcriptional activator